MKYFIHPFGLSPLLVIGRVILGPSLSLLVCLSQLLFSFLHFFMYQIEHTQTQWNVSMWRKVKKANDVFVLSATADLEGCMVTQSIHKRWKNSAIVWNILLTSGSTFTNSSIVLKTFFCFSSYRLCLKILIVALWKFYDYFTISIVF